MYKVISSSWTLVMAVALAASAVAAAQGPGGAQGPGRGQGEGPGRAGGPGRGGPPPSALRSVPAETLAAKAKDPNWKAPRTLWGHPDPVTYTAPFTLRMTITSQPGYEMYEYSCHEGNGAVKCALSADREYERQVAEAKAKGLPIPPRVMGMAVYTGQAVEGREEVREFGGR